MTPDGPEDFDEFVAVYWPRLVRVAHMLTGDFHEAEDLVQVTLVKVYAQWRRLSHVDIQVYVRQALINNNRSRLRKKRVAQLLSPFIPEALHRSHHGDAEALEHRAVLVQAMSALPARQRAVVILRYWDDMSEQDVAEILNCSVGSVKTHAHRGLRALRAHPELATYTSARS
ncbi:SigE family RNA polymerase sigma factor [Streptomyces sp900105245]|uniref:SigE family RNA polymerase sigma factor n=1 Tax=Streptomyces sp. 900105245 TaxID=3154379 RepID=A0ABV1UKK2_9ACTN